MIDSTVEKLSAEFLSTILKLSKLESCQSLFDSIHIKSQSKQSLNLVNKPSTSPAGWDTTLGIYPKNCSLQTKAGQTYFRICIHHHLVLQEANMGFFFLESTDPDLFILFSAPTVRFSALAPSLARVSASNQNPRDVVAQFFQRDNSSISYEGQAKAKTRYLWVPKFRKNEVITLHHPLVSELNKCFVYHPNKPSLKAPVGFV